MVRAPSFHPYLLAESLYLFYLAPFLSPNHPSLPPSQLRHPPDHTIFFHSGPLCLLFSVTHLSFLPPPPTPHLLSLLTLSLPPHTLSLLTLPLPPHSPPPSSLSPSLLTPPPSFLVATVFWDALKPTKRSIIRELPGMFQVRSGCTTYRYRPAFMFLLEGTFASIPCRVFHIGFGC